MVTMYKPHTTIQIKGIGDFLKLLRRKLPRMQVQFWDKNVIGRKYISGEYHVGTLEGLWLMILRIPYPFTKRKMLIRLTTFLKDDFQNLHY